MIDEGLSHIAVTGGEDQRLVVAPPRATVAARSRFAALLALVLAIHAAVLGWFLHRDSTLPVEVTQAAEVPVEVVQEPPPPPPAPKPPEKPEALEKPATSAPRAGSKDPVEAKSAAARTAAPKTAAPARSGQRPPSQAAAEAEQTAAPDRKTAAEKEDDQRDAEALDKAKINPEKSKETEAEAKPKVAEAVPELARQAAAALDAPSFDFAAASKLSEFPPGDEDNRYLAVVFAKVMSKNRYSASAAARRGASGVVSVSFVVDFMGRVPYQTVSESSGQPDLDALAMAAVRGGAPYPPPPGSGSQQLVARMRFGP